MPNCPECRKSHPFASLLRLYHSENECPICMEKKEKMFALPCGHQFCEEDLKTIGFNVQPNPIRRLTGTRTPPMRQPRQIPPAAPRRIRRMTNRHTPPVRIITPPMRQRRQPPPAPLRIRRMTGPSSRLAARLRRIVGRDIIDLTGDSTTTRRRRCGWCAHIGHTQKTCTLHRRECGCRSFKSPKHKRVHRRKTTCVVCGKKGHRYQTCHVVVTN